jgi:CheY-like chemotaxis protein
MTRKASGDRQALWSWRAFGLPRRPTGPGIEAFQAHKQEIALVVSDITMPNLDGVGLQQAIHQQGDRVPFLFISGLPPEDVLQASSGMETDVLAKPWTVAELTERVRQILSGT